MDIESILLAKRRSLFGLDYIKSDNATSLNTLIDSNVISNSLFNINNSLYINGSATISSTFTAMSNVTTNNILRCSNIISSGNSILANTTSCLSNISSNIANIDTMLCNQLYCSNSSIITNGSIGSSLYNLSSSSIINNLTILSNLYISSSATLNKCSMMSILNISSNSYIENINIAKSFVVSGNSIFNQSINTSTLTIMGNIIANNITTLTDIYINKDANLQNSIIKNSATISTNLYISNTSILNNLAINGNLQQILPEYETNTAANALPLWSFYRTGGIVKIRIPDIDQIVSLNGTSPMTLYINDNLIDPGANASDGSNISITGTVSTTKVGSYIRYYTAIDNSGLIKNTITRLFNVIQYPIISSIIKSGTNIIVTAVGIYNVLTYKIDNNNNVNIIPETSSLGTIIDVSSITTGTYYIYVYLKRDTGDILTSNSFIFSNS